MRLVCYRFLQLLLQIFALLLQNFALLLQNFALLFGINCTEINQSQSSNIFKYIINGKKQRILESYFSNINHIIRFLDSTAVHYHAWYIITDVT